MRTAKGEAQGRASSSLVRTAPRLTFHRTNVRCFLSGTAGQEDTPSPSSVEVLGIFRSFKSSPLLYSL